MVSLWTRFVYGTFNPMIRLLAVFVRGTAGTDLVDRKAVQPKKMLELYSFEWSPYCRLVREVLCEMEIDYILYPVPPGGKRYRKDAINPKIGKARMPMLHDPNTGVTMHESDEIVDYITKTYNGKPRANTHGWRRTLAVFTSVIATLLDHANVMPWSLDWRALFKGRIGYAVFHTIVAVPSAEPPAKMLEIYTFESSPYSIPARTYLDALQLPYIVRNTPKGHWKDLGPPFFREKVWKGDRGTTRNRKALQARSNFVQVPYLVDPNTGVEMYESQKIIAYLKKTYELERKTK
eukprot:Clim_evm13s44 gene=Clim_evmTU13s44